SLRPRPRPPSDELTSTAHCPRSRCMAPWQGIQRWIDGLNASVAGYVSVIQEIVVRSYGYFGKGTRELVTDLTPGHRPCAPERVGGRWAPGLTALRRTGGRPGSTAAQIGRASCRGGAGS